jgi:hypothetical protein
MNELRYAMRLKFTLVSTVRTEHMRKISVFFIFLVTVTMVSVSQFVVYRRLIPDPFVAGADPPTNVVSDNSKPLQRPGVESPYFSFEESTMPKSFLEHLQYQSRSINRNWKKNGWVKFMQMDISSCLLETPECEMHRHIFPEKDSINEKPFRKCCVEHKMLREVTLWVIEKFEANNIEYFLSTGTALGARRHNGTMVPWDTDVDLAVHPKYERQIETLLKDNQERFFHMDTLGKKMFWIHYSANGKPSGGPHVEVFFEPDYTKHPESLYPLEKCLFYNRSVACPNLKMFDVWYPTGWKTYGGDHYHDDCRTTIYDKGKRREVSRC